MSELKRKLGLDLLGSDSHDSEDDSSGFTSPGSDDCYESCKRRKIDLDSTILDLGYTGKREELNDFSKSKKKKLIKHLKYLNNKPLKRKEEKVKKKMKLLQKKLNGIQIISRKAKKCNSMANSNCKLSVVIDLSFDDLMSDKDIHKCMNQINRCYCVNRQVTDPMQFHVTHLNGKSKDVISKFSGYENWDVKLNEQSYLEIFDKNQLVYLTSDSNNIIEELDEKKVYIIGGLVDHNTHKNLCYRIACEEGLAHGRLPIDKYLNMKTRKVLAINHVFEIMLHVARGMSWKDAFLKVIPQRKNVVPKSDNLTSENTEIKVEQNDSMKDEDEEKPHDYDELIKGSKSGDLNKLTSKKVSDS